MLVARAYKTHVELARELGRTPGYVARRAVNHVYGDYYHSGGIFYFPTVKGETAFVEMLVASLYSLG